MPKRQSHLGNVGYLDGLSEPRLQPRESPEEVAGVRWWSARLDVDESNDFRGLNRVGGRLLLDTTTRFGLQTSWTWLHERLDADGPGRAADDMVLGDVNGVYRFAQGERAEFRAGLGARILADGDHSHYGFNFTYGVDLFPVRPLILSATLDAGTLGSAGVFHARATAGVALSAFEVFAGYDYLRIGSVDLQGPVIGLRVWF
jgi:hypothetical protein